MALVDLVERVHAQGLVLRDLSPGNVLVRPDGSLRLVDLEPAVDAGTVAGSAGTPGYRAPEHSGPQRTGRAEYAADLFALGGLLFLLATGHDPLLPEDLPRARSAEERLGRRLALAAREGETARHSGAAACHGLAGDGEYLLDLAQATGESRFRHGAEELARLIAARAALRDGLLVLPDETGTGCTPAYGTGTSGALASLLRLRHGGPRLWADTQPPSTAAELAS